MMESMDQMFTADGGRISNIALGTLYFGSRISREHSERLLNLFFEEGGNQIDTARSYAEWLKEGAGASENVIGNWLLSGKRESVFLGTKGGLMPRGYNETRGNLEREHLERERDASLKALRTDYIDLYWLHRDDLRYEAGEVVEMMNDWIRQGKIRYFGVSNWSTKRIKEANAYAESHGLQKISASQIQYGLGVCTAKDWGDESVICMDGGEYEEYKKLMIPVYAYSAQAEGYFPIYLEKGVGALSQDTRKKYDTKVNRERAGRLAELVRKKGVSLSWVMAEYVFRSPFPAVFIMGGSNEDRMKEILELDRKHTRQLTEEEWEGLVPYCAGACGNVFCGHKIREKNSNIN